MRRQVLANLTDSGLTANRNQRRNGLPLRRSGVHISTPTRDESYDEQQAPRRFGRRRPVGACADKNESATTGTGAAATSGPVPGSQEDLVANVGDRVFYAFDRSTLAPDARTTLDRQAGWLGKYQQVNVQVAGNCDDRGTEEYNLALGQRRANSARDYLVARGVVGSRTRSATARTGRPRSATTSSRGRRTATPSPRSADPIDRPSAARCQPAAAGPPVSF